MQMNALIPMAGETPDIVGSFARGQQVRQQGLDFQNQNALRGFLEQNGAGIMAGDQNALAGLARFDPQAALGVQESRLGMDATRHGMKVDEQRLSLARQEAAQRTQAIAAQMSAAERAAKAEEGQRVAAMATVAYHQGPEAWAQWNQQFEQFEDVAFDDAPVIIAGITGAAEGFIPKAVEPLSPEGKLATDVANGILPEQPVEPYNFSAEESLRKEFTALAPVKTFQGMTEAYGRIAASAKDPSPAGDLALIFSFMKILDPASVVRETEFANAQNAAGVPDQIRNLYNRVMSGERLNEEQRLDFVGRAEALYSQAEAQVAPLIQQYGGIADARGLDRTRALPDFGFAGERLTIPPASPAAPAGPVQIQSVQEYNDLPPGTVYIDPTGKQRTKR